MELIIKQFIEENWAEFLAHCQQHGIESEDEIDAEIERVLGRDG